ncbi:CGNR zinc finger domain-containing protein [Streptomyces sp. NPDC102365]|uniref:CGNR zinc finger domain-containing protein n=1 Tax=Streptomyces sp. NPDC102365 TaxID=3366162 RepID=UPI00382D50CF
MQPGCRLQPAARRRPRHGRLRSSGLTPPPPRPTLGPARLGVCAGPTCRATFVDLSRNGSKQYCTRTCAHRASVAAYRSRRSPR